MKTANRCPSRNRVLPGKLAAVAGWSFFGSQAATELARHQARIVRILRGRRQSKIRPRVLLLLPCGARLDHAQLRAAFAHARRTRWEPFAGSILPADGNECGPFPAVRRCLAHST